jgi:hypothetical protein
MHRSPLDQAALYVFRTSKVDDYIDTVRLFSDTMDFSNDESDGNIFLGVLLHWIPISLRQYPDQLIAAVLWTLKFLAPDLKDTMVEASFTWHLEKGFRWSGVDIFDLLLGLTDHGIDARSKPGGYSMLLRKVVWLGTTDILREQIRIITLLKKNADPHLIGFDQAYSPRKETSTSLAMYNSRSFFNWRFALRESSVDLDTFVREELHQGPLQKAGWTEDSLMSLFELDIPSGFQIPDFERCELCPRYMAVVVEIPWRRWLDKIKEVLNSNILLKY